MVAVFLGGWCASLGLNFVEIFGALGEVTGGAKLDLFYKLDFFLYILVLSFCFLGKRV